MKKATGVIGAIVFLAVAAVAVWLCGTYLGSGNWPQRFHSELDEFFGEGNWQCISEEEKESRMYTVTVRSANTGLDTEEPGTYKNWNIEWTTPAGEKEIWTITNHALKINHDRNGLLSGKRLSNKEAFILELREIAESIAAEEVRKDIIEKILTKEEADCLAVYLSYHGGNPAPEFYDNLWEEEWFRADAVTADQFLSTELYDFYIRVQVYDYRFEKLSNEEQQHVIDSFDAMQQALLEQYGNHASFEIYLGEGYSVEYIDGVKQD